MEISAVDLFCGAGGLTYGLEQAGLPVVAGIDLNSRCKYPYDENTNSEFIEEDIQRLAKENPERVAQLFGDSDVCVLAGCAPCQPFSPLNHGDDSKEHQKWGLLNAFSALVKVVEPDIVTMENVYEVRNHDVYDEFEETLSDLGYWINSDENKRVYCPEYGVPQTRKRWVLLASRRGPINLKGPVHKNESEYPTVKDTIENLPAISAGETHSEDSMHRSRDLADVNIERIKISEPGKTWKLWEEKGYEDLLLACHKKSSGRTYTDPYGRMTPDKPAPTITTQFYNYGSGRFGHYDMGQNRAISLREGAMLQTFPRDYKFIDSPEENHLKPLGEMIGNAVPPKLGEVIGKSIIHHVENTARQERLKNFHV
ncbi:DNA cytosine methyltransferase [Natronosalvus halobius]|uniref:DNA cytosine methyltransferase n=1 Tax=Natronosalvus halobius TaxID=2953746 RepID=UPI0020A1CD2E|nr:DNA cytosine methyltransferase [Natronosalvus halobius]USZ73228.1 DNA cytosine methyltransferase [Natronosalvus halobius]